MQDNLDKVRIDKWLWAVRICKTRQISADLCKKERVTVDGQKVKPSKEVKPGQNVTVKKEGIIWKYRVVRCIGKRAGAQIAAQCREDLTLPEEVDKLKIIKSLNIPQRARGSGRPTKKERRDIDKFIK